MDNLPKDAKKLLCLMYKDYLSKRADGMDKKKAKYYNNSLTIKERLHLSESLNDVNETLFEIKRAGYISLKRGVTATVSDIIIADETIVFMEQKFKNGVKDILSFLSDLIPGIIF